MYTKAQVDEMLLQVEQEFERTLESITKNEKNQIVEEPAEIGSEEFETIDDLYASMSKNEIEAHYSSLKKVMMTKSEEEKEEEKEEKEKKDSKKEDKKDDKKEDQEVEIEIEKCGDMSVKKSEQSLAQENKELKKNLETLNDLVSKLFSSKKAPTQKAITATSFIAKSEENEIEVFDISEMSKGEVTAKLKALDFQSLSKSDRDAINNFYLQNGSVEKIKHLISK
jgi:hypothetical protein